jgi:hypothetical protein
MWIAGAIALTAFAFAPAVDQMNRRLQRIIELLNDIKMGRRDF